MTNEEAINVLNDYDINFERNTVEEVAEAHEMAIKVLEEQPSERTEMHECDCISRKGHWIEHKHGGIEHIECSKCRCWFLRKDLIRNSYCPNCGSYNGGDTNPQPSENLNVVLDELNRIGRNAFKDDTDYDNLFDFISNLPSVSSQPKTAHWEWTQYDSKPNFGNWHCSACRSIVVEHVPKTSVDGIPLYKYCPQCGAKMQEVQQ